MSRRIAIFASEVRQLAGVVTVATGRDGVTGEPLFQVQHVSRGALTPATVAHHEIPHKGNAILFFDPANLVSSCKNCHDVDEPRIERAAVRDKRSTSTAGRSRNQRAPRFIATRG